MEDSTLDRIKAVAVTAMVHLSALIFLLHERRSFDVGGLILGESSTGLYVDYVIVAETLSSTPALKAEGIVHSQATASGDASKPANIGSPMSNHGPVGAAVEAEAPAALISRTPSMSTKDSVASGEDDPVGRYRQALIAAILHQHRANGGGPLDNGCKLSIRQSRGGGVLAVNALNCSLKIEDEHALEAAALMAQPLPYLGFEAVFSEALDLVVVP